MKTETPITIRLKDYKQPDYWIKNTKLEIRIFDSYTEVLSELSMVKNDSVSGLPALVLDGVDQQIQSLAFDDFVITEYDYSGEKLTVQPTADEFVFKAVTRIEPGEKYLTGRIV